MEVLEAVKLRLGALGYEVKDEDAAVLDYNIQKAETTLKIRTNQRKVPEGLFYVWVDMAAGLFLLDKDATGDLSGSTAFDTDAPVKSIKEGDVTITYAVSDSAGGESTGGFDGVLERMVNPDDDLIFAFRRLVW